jgi:protein SCO1/2
MDWVKRAKAGALTVLLLAVGCQRNASEGFAVVPARPAPALEAPRASGGVFRLSEQRGKVVLLSFGYTACPDVCPTTLSQLRRFEEKLGDSADNVEVVFLSVDPERDSAQRLEEYVRAFHPRFTGLRLERPALEAVLSAYQVTAVRRYPDSTRYRERPFAAGSPYTVDHTGAYLVIDARGTLRLRLPYTATLEQMQAAVEPLLAEAHSP